MDVKCGLVFSIFVVISSGFLIKTPVLKINEDLEYRELGWLQQQKLILPLFEDVCDESTDPVLVRAASEFNLDTAGSNFTNPDVITDFKNLKTKGFLPKGEVFTEYNVDHLNELKIIYEVLYNAKDFDTFFKSAAWARQNINCVLFVDAIYTAVLKRKDTQHLTIPAPYELIPWYFIKRDHIVKAATLLNNNVAELINDIDGLRNEGNTIIVDTNYTADYYDNDDESVLAYFQEDIGLNSYHFLNRLKNAPWFNKPTGLDSKYGEFLYFTLKQLSTRYDLERYSNGLANVDVINWDNLKTVPYDPKLVYTSGNYFGARRSEGVVVEDEDTTQLKDIENNIALYVSHVMKYVQDKSAYSKTQILNNLMEILVTKDNSYDVSARRVLDKTIRESASLDHFMTSLRDPMYWRLNKKIVNLIDQSLQVLPKYTKKQLYFPGVEIINVDVKKLVTMCEEFEFDVTDALRINSKPTFQVKFEQPRLSHKPFTIKITIASFVRQKGLVKVFLGPKTVPGDFSKSKDSFMLLDSFETTFKLGTNVITRTSDEMTYLSKDFESLRTLRKKILDAEFGLDVAPLSIVRDQTGFPSRLILPKGSADGLPFQLFVFVAPYVKLSVNSIYSPADLDFHQDAITSPGYPLDLGIEDTDLVELPNALIKDIIITHKGENKGYNYAGDSETKQWNTSDDVVNDEPSPSRPARTFGQGGSFDYRSKKGQFDYKTKKTQYGKKDYSSYRTRTQTTTESVNIEIPHLPITIENVLEIEKQDVTDKAKSNFDDSDLVKEPVIASEENGLEEHEIDDHLNTNLNAGRIIFKHPLLSSRKYSDKKNYNKIIVDSTLNSQESDAEHIIPSAQDVNVDLNKQVTNDESPEFIKTKIDKVISKNVNVDKNFYYDINKVIVNMNKENDNKHKGVGKQESSKTKEIIDKDNENSLENLDINRVSTDKAVVITYFNNDPSEDSIELLNKDDQIFWNSPKTLTIKQDDHGIRVFTQDDSAQMSNDEAEIIEPSDVVNEDKKRKRCNTIYDFMIGNCSEYEKVYQ